MGLPVPQEGEFISQVEPKLESQSLNASDASIKRKRGGPKMNVIRKVKVLQGEAKKEADEKGLNPEDLVIVQQKGLEKIEGDPVSYLIKRGRGRPKGSKNKK